MRSSILFPLLGIAIAVAGCGGSSNSGGTGGAGGSTGGASAGTAGGGSSGTGGAPACIDVVTPDSGDTCNVVAAGGPCVTGTFSTAAAPTATGGAFAGGTYNLVSQIFYGSAAAEQTFLPGQPFRQTYVLSDVTPTSFTLDQAWRLGTGIARSHETAALAGMTATFTQTCPSRDGGIDWSRSVEFTATPSSITLFRSTMPSTNVQITEVTVYEKAP